MLGTSKPAFLVAQCHVRLVHKVHTISCANNRERHLDLWLPWSYLVQLGRLLITWWMLTACIVAHLHVMDDNRSRAAEANVSKLSTLVLTGMYSPQHRA